MLPWSNVRGGLWRVNEANEVDESILSTGNSKCKEKKSKRETWFIWEQRDGLWVEHRKCKDNNKKQVAHFSSFPRPHCRVPPSVLACQPQGGTQDPVPGLWPLCHPKGVDFVSQDCTKSSWAASISFHIRSCQQSSKGKTWAIKFQVTTTAPQMPRVSCSPLG